MSAPCLNNIEAKTVIIFSLGVVSAMFSILTSSLSNLYTPFLTLTVYPLMSLFILGLTIANTSYGLPFKRPTIIP